MRKSLFACVWIALLAAGTAVASAAGGPASPPRRIVLVTIDTWRWDALGASGLGKVRTPRLDELAKAGSYCPKAWSSATLTAPSHATILTGLEPYHHGVRNNHGFKLEPDARTLAEAFRAAGYRTAAFISAHPVSRISGLDKGFDVFDDRLPTGDTLSVTPRCRSGADTIEAARAWLRTAPNRFFLWVHLYEPHHPYAPPEPFRSEYREAPYFGEVAYVDELIGRLQAALKQAGANDALWVVCGDHGEALGEHGEATHALFVYDVTARVPLIIWAPGRVPAARLDSARLVDVAPTILKLSGLPIPAGADGRSLFPVEKSATRRPAYVETIYAFLDFGAAPVRALSDGRFKVIDVPEREVYDLDRDPGETRNLAAQPPSPQTSALWKALAAIPSTRRAASTGDGDDTAAALRSLGYVGASGEYPLGEKGMDPKKFAPLYHKLDQAPELFSARRWSEARSLYRELMAAFPRSSLLAAQAGLAEFAAGQPAAAQPFLRRALDLDPRNTQALLGMANLAIARQDHHAAEGFLLQVLAIDVDDAEANFDLGALYYQNLGQPARAARYWERFLAANPKDPEAPRIRGLLDSLKAGPPAPSGR